MLSAVLITLNEENNIAACLDSIRWADEIVVVDSGSTDQTRSIARGRGARVYEIPFRDFASQKNSAIEQAKGDWILLLDADERITDALSEEIRTVIERGTNTVYAIARATFFFGRPLRFSGAQHDAPIRLFPRGRARLSQPVHEEIVTELPVRRLENAMLHYSTADKRHYQEKLDRYLPLEMEVLKMRRQAVRPWDRWLRPLGKFISLYFLHLGFLDGLTGLQYAVFSSYYVHLKYKRYYGMNHERTS